MKKKPARRLSVTQAVAKTLGGIPEDQAKAILNDFAYYVNRNLRASRLRRSGWSQPDAPDRDMPRQDREKAMAMARQKVEESAVAYALVDGTVANVVGSGYRLSMRTGDKNFNKLIESKWKAYRDSIDIRGMRSFPQLLRCWNWRKRVDGDVGLLRATLGGDFKIATIEADRIRKMQGGQDQGVDYNPVTGEPVTWYVGARVKDSTDSKAKSAPGKPYPAKDFRLYAHFPGERVECERGVSALTNNLSLFEDVEDILMGMVQKVKNAAFIGLKFTRKPSENADLKEDPEDGKKRKHVPMVPGINLGLVPGEDAEVLESSTPNAEFIPFLELLIRLLGAPFGFPLEMLTLNMTETSYSGGRAMFELARRRARIEQDDLCLVASWVFKGWLDHEIKRKSITVPAGLELYHTHKWGLPVWPSLNPTDDMAAYGLQLDRNITTLDAVLAETSEYDLEDLIEQRKYERSLITEAGLTEVTGQQVVQVERDESTGKTKPRKAEKPGGER